MADEALDVSPTPDTGADAADNAAAPETNTAIEAGTDVNEATTSSDVGDKSVPETKETLLSVVKRAAEENPEASNGNSLDPEKREASEKDAAGKEVSPDDAMSDEKLPFGKHPRWKALIEERNGLRGEAGEYRKISGFLTEHRIEPAEAAQALRAAALVKGAFEGRNDPKEALEFLDQWRTDLAKLAGVELPDDLKERVEQGYVDEASATELSVARTKAAFAEQRSNLDAQRQTHQEALSRVSANQNAAVAWEAQRSASDPDYSRKQKAVERYARALIAEHGAPENPAQVQQLLDAAYKEVNATLVVPNMQSTATTPRSHSSTSTGTAAAPKSLAEAVALAARGR